MSRSGGADGRFATNGAVCDHPLRRSLHCWYGRTPTVLARRAAHARFRQAKRQRGASRRRRLDVVCSKRELLVIGDVRSSKAAAALRPASRVRRRSDSSVAEVQPTARCCFGLEVLGSAFRLNDRPRCCFCLPQCGSARSAPLIPRGHRSRGFGRLATWRAALVRPPPPPRRAVPGLRPGAPRSR
jgi:hypothetical protein